MSGKVYKMDVDFSRHNEAAFDLTAEDLRRFIEEVESDDAQVADIRRDRADRFTVMKSKGYNVKALRRILADRKKDAAQERELQEVVELYRSILL